jgi:hypothetical protein
MKTKRWSRLLPSLGLGCILLLTGQAQARVIGGYVDRAEERFVRNVWNFIKEFQTYQAVGSQSWKYSQYYYMQPYMFTTANDSWTDSMDFIFASGHGNTYYLQTNQSTSTGVSFSSDMASGDGLGDYNAEYLVIESCLTVASLAESSDPWSNWMDTLKGLHQIVGFRTVSYSDNGIPNNYARKLKAGGCVWNSWFNAVNEERSYAYGTFYPGMASAIFYDGTRYDTLATAGYPDPRGWGGWNQGRDWGYIWNWYQYE